MPLTVSASGLDTAGTTLRGFDAAVREAAAASSRSAAAEARQAAIHKTADVYNLTAEKIGEYISVDPQQSGALGATLRIKVRAIPLQAFQPEVRMQRFTIKNGKHKTSRLLPAVYFTRLRGDAPRYLRPAFPLHQRTSGPLAAGDRIVKRTGKGRGNLTSFRFYTFPQQFRDQQLIPAVQTSLREGFTAEFKVADRLASGHLRNNQP